MDSTLLIIGSSIIGVLIGFAIAKYLEKNNASSYIKNAKKEAASILKDAKIESEAIKKTKFFKQKKSLLS